MIVDIWTIAWKEWKELIGQQGFLRGGRLGLLFFLAVFGIFLPLQMGRDLVESPASLIYWAWVPLFLVIGVIADSFAGERERHTLETLLASRLSDRAILFGKIAAAIAYGYGLMLISLFLGLVTVNLFRRQQGILFFSPELALGILVLGLLGAMFAATVGVLVSLRAPTVRQAQQILSIGIMLLLFVPVFGVQLLPASVKIGLAEALTAVDITRVAIAVMVGLALLDTGLLVAAIARFRRTRLILD